MWSASLCRSSISIHLQSKVCEGFVSRWLGSRTFWTLSKAAEKGQLVSLPKFEGNKWSSFCWKFFSTAHIGISSFNMIFYVLFKVMQWRMNVCLPSFLLLGLCTSPMKPIAVGEGRRKRTILFCINCHKAKCFCFNNVAQKNHCYKPVFRNRYLSQNTSQLRCVLGTLYDVFSSHSVERNVSTICLALPRWREALEETPILEGNMLCSQVSPLTGCVLAFSVLCLRFPE